MDIFTRATSSSLAPIVEVADNVLVRHIHAGPFEGLTKGELPGQLCTFAREVMRAEASHLPGHYDAIHSHYWLSGQVGALARDRWGVPLVHSMHTMAKVKNAALAEGDTPEPRRPADRRGAGGRGRRHADRQHRHRGAPADRAVRRRARARRRGASRCRPQAVHPRPRADARRRLGLPVDAHVLLFAGRIQPLKAPDVLLKAVAVLLEGDPQLRSRLVVPIVGGPSGSGLEHPEALADLVDDLGLGDVVRFVPPVDQAELAEWCRAATLVAVPSYNESFGLVAAEAQATGTPVVAAAVGGLTTVVRDGRSGLLVDTHEPRDWAARAAPRHR